MIQLVQQFVNSGTTLKVINDNPPNDLNFFLKIMEKLITKGNITLKPKEATEEHLNDLSRKRKAMGATTYTHTRQE